MYERGEREPGIETLGNIADFFNVDLDYLFGRTDIPNKYLITFGTRLAHYRKEAGYTQKSFADALGITPTRLNYWEKDKREPDIPMLKNMLDLLNIEADILIFGYNRNNTLSGYNKLNLEGQNKVKIYIDDLLENPKYTTSDIIEERRAASASLRERLDIAAFGGNGKRSTKKDRRIT